MSKILFKPTNCTNSPWIVHYLFTVWNNWDSHLFIRCRFSDIKNTFNKTVSTVIVNLEKFCKISVNSSENYGKINFFSVTGWKTLICHFLRKFFFSYESQTSQLSDTALNPNCKVPTWCLFSVIENLFVFCKCEGSVCYALEKVYKKTL